MLSNTFITSSIVAASFLANIHSTYAQGYLASPAATGDFSVGDCLSQKGISYINKANSTLYTQTTTNLTWNTRNNLAPALYASPINVDQVSQAVKCGVQGRLYITAISGGHSYAANGLGGENGHFIINLAALTTFQVNGENVFVGTGNRLGDVLLGLEPYNRALPHGTCPTVGIGGHSKLQVNYSYVSAPEMILSYPALAAYGGFGYLTRSWGYLLDHAVAAQVVIATGEVKNVSATAEPDLFWALRGAGGSFGVLTGWTFKTEPKPASMSSSLYDYNGLTADQAAELLFDYQAWSLKAPSKMGSTLKFSDSPLGVVNLYVQFTYLGSQADMQASIADFRAIHPGKTAFSRETSYIQLAKDNTGDVDLASNDPGHTQSYTKSLMPPQGQPSTKAAFLALTTYLAANAGHLSDNKLGYMFQFELAGGPASKANQIPLSSTAFGVRDALYINQIAVWHDDATSPFPQQGFDFVNGAVNAWTSAMGPEWKYHMYANYVDPFLTAAQGAALYFDANFPKLQKIKEQYDPQDVFHVPAPLGVPPSRGLRRL